LNSIAAININTLVYSPYNNDDSCKSADQVHSDLNLIKSVGVSALRVYATDCNTDNTVLPVAQQLGMKVAQGFYFIWS
jgi:exo-beta-1,3-glucanase (GH17 family)